ncbi:MAG TPA: TIGR02300 family protein [Thermoanaerobaculia bacterium]|nr:TIGR02300 family protein [Thermoanaerobaculia bacterium]
MPELKLGTKHECFSCGTKFYDLGKNEAICPKCGANQKDASSSEAPAAGQASRRRRKAEIVAKTIEVEEEEPVADIDEEIVPDGDISVALGDDEEEAEEDFDDEE